MSTSRYKVTLLKRITHQNTNRPDGPILLPPGEYYVTDPCFVLSDVVYDEALTACYYTTYYEKDGRGMVVLPTGHGDGVFNDHQGREYGVEAGCIGVIPKGMGDPEILDETVVYGWSHLVTFEKPFECFSDEGMLHFGHIVIDTR